MRLLNHDLRIAGNTHPRAITAPKAPLDPVNDIDIKSKPLVILINDFPNHSDEGKIVKTKWVLAGQQKSEERDRGEETLLFKHDYNSLLMKS